MVSLLNFSYASRNTMVCDFNLHFCKDWRLSLFPCVNLPPIRLLWWCVQIFWVIFFLSVCWLTEFSEFLIYWGRKCFISCMIGQIYDPLSLQSVFRSFTNVFWRADVFTFDQLQLNHLSFYGLCFWWWIWKNPRSGLHEDILLCYKVLKF